VTEPPKGSQPKLFLPEDFSGKCLDRCSFLPGIGWQSRFAAGLLQERDSVPVVLERNLRQKQAAVSGHADDQAVAANLDCFRRDRFWRRQDAEFDLQFARFVASDPVETGIFKCGGARGIGYCAIYRADGQNVADASTQLAMQIKRTESAARFGEMGGGSIEGNVTLFERGENRVVRQLQ